MEFTLATRPVRPDDLARFYALWPRLSRDTRYRRFHSPVRCLPAESVRRLVEVDHDLRDAIVAVVGDDVVGVARYDRSTADPSTAEFAILVEDAWQGVGVGRQLLVEIAGLAAGRGVRTLLGIVQRDNDRMLSLIRRVLPGATVATEDDDVYEVRGPLNPGDFPARTLPAAALASA
jgi:GNAT superfamily N-acetyltransferase